MGKDRSWIRMSAFIGTVLIWATLLLPIILGISRFSVIGHFQVDYLMPAEFGLVVLIGAGLLLLAAVMSRKRIRWIAWCMGIAIFLVAGSQAAAVMTGLASGAVETTGWQFEITLGMIIGYDLALVALGIEGIYLCRDLLRLNKE
jgi:hypothetical protein